VVRVTRVQGVVLLYGHDEPMEKLKELRCSPVLNGRNLLDFYLRSTCVISFTSLYAGRT
jgi:hypothetical protein